MFIQLSDHLVNNGLKAEDVFSLHPYQILAFLDALWETGRSVQNPKVVLQPDAGIGGAYGQKINGPPPAPPPVPPASALRDALLRVLQGAYKDPSSPLLDLGGDLFADHAATHLSNLVTKNDRLWGHLIYAYCIENTRVYEVCNRLLVELIHGERLGSLSAASHRWVRASEELFFRDSMPSLIATLVSSIRPDIRATRRNAYYRMFAMDLNHGTLDNRPYVYEKSESANTAFVPTFEQFLREIWRGYVNASNTSGPNTTDKSVIAELARRLREMMSERRRNGTLSREEFVSIAAMSWFHLTLSSNTPVVVDLKADASTPEERLRKLGERVGVGTHSRSRAFFTLAEPLSQLLSLVEAGTFDLAANVGGLYDPATPPPNNYVSVTLAILHHWSAATGRDLKATSVVQRTR